MFRTQRASHVSSRLPGSLCCEALESRRLLAAAIVVRAGESIQAAINSAPAGATIRIDKGTFAEAITINTSNLTLVGSGEGKTIITNPGGANNGISVQANGDGVDISQLTVRNFARNGIVLIGADNYSISHVAAEDNARYGLFPIRSNKGNIDHCTASGSNDTGIYVGSLDGATISHCEVFNNVSGINIENSSSVICDHNDAHDNVVGIESILLPGLSVLVSDNVTIAHNDVSNNNHTNFAPPGSIPAALPSGMGILVIGTDDTTVEKNHVDGNNFVGIGVLSTTIVGALAGIPPAAFLGNDYNPDRVLVSDNHLSDNGIASPLPGFPPVDLFWDGSGVANHWEGNHFDTSFPPVLP